jgi:hypothetical protein
MIMTRQNKKNAKKKYKQKKKKFNIPFPFAAMSSCSFGFFIFAAVPPCFNIRFVSFFFCVGRPADWSRNSWWTHGPERIWLAYPLPAPPAGSVLF